MRFRTLLSRIIICLTLHVSTDTMAMPFNSDMVDGQMKPGSIARPADPKSVPIGSLSRYLPSKEAALPLENPLKGDKASSANGERLFATFCTPCHGTFKDGKHASSFVSTLFPGAPDLSLKEIAVKPDGHFFQFEHFGGLVMMPVYGYKLSITEHWDIVNYIREIQKNRKD